MTTPAGSTDNKLLFDSVMDIILDKQGVKQIDTQGKIHSMEPVDREFINRLRETSKDLKTCADNVLTRLNIEAPHQQLVKLDRSVQAVKAVFNAETGLLHEFGQVWLDTMLWSAYAQSQWLTPEAIDRIVTRDGNEAYNNWIHESLLLNQQVPINLRRKLGELLLNQMDIDTRQSLAADAGTLPEWLEILANDPEPAVRLLVARNESTPGSTLTNMARKGDIQTTRAVATNKHAPEPLLFYLAGHRDEQVRKNVANNTSISQRTMRLLCNDNNEEVLVALAGNHCLTPDIFRLLASKRSVAVKLALANNPFSPPDLLIELAKSPVWAIRYEVASNEEAPPEALRNTLQPLGVLTRQDHKMLEWVKPVVASHLHTPPALLLDLAKEPNWDLRHRVVMNEAAPTEAFEIVLEAFNELREAEREIHNTEAYRALTSVRLMAEQIHTPTSILEQLYRLEPPAWDIWDEWDDIKLSLAENPNIPVWIMQDIIRHGTEDQREALSENPGLPADLAMQFPDTYTQLTQLVAFNDREALAEILLNAELPNDAHDRVPGLYQTLLNADDKFVDIAMAGMTTTPQFALLELVERDDFDIKSALASNTTLPQTAVNTLIEVVTNALPHGDMSVGIRNLAIALIQNQIVPVESLARWLLRATEVDDVINADPRWQKVAARIIELDEADEACQVGGRPTKRLRLS